MTPLISLVMIVRDEAAIIDRCLASAVGLVDTWTICDTGSTDDTPALVQAALADKPGQLVHHDWVDYGHNRTAAWRQARGTADWLLRVDADWEVIYSADFHDWLATNPDPTVDAWDVTIRAQGLDWSLPLLTRGRQVWQYVGATHEYLETGGRRTRPVTGLSMRDNRDGTSRKVKGQRDLALLQQGFDRGDPRSTFYMARTMHDMGYIGAAAAIYKLRASMGGYPEEVWYAAYQAARLTRDVNALVDVWRTRPWRHEPLRAAAAIVASQPNNDRLFREGWDG